ncbi:hypothetical protein [Pedobacter sp. P26]|uniref:hypothetical protein n=1 Tax=Pedobacter sp. P26 TaxID=3423956 RepID=UPI003D66B77A
MLPKSKKGKPQIAASGTFTLSPYRQYTNNLTNSADIVDLEKEWAANNPNLRGANAGTYAANLLQNVAYPSQGINAILKNAAGTLSQADLNTKLGQLAAGGYQYYDDVEKYSKRSPFYQQYNLSIGNATEKMLCTLLQLTAITKHRINMRVMNHLASTSTIPLRLING